MILWTSIYFQGVTAMKKYILFYLFVFLLTAIVFADISYYYTSRTGDIFQSGTNAPIGKYSKMNLLCNTFFISYKMDRYFIVNDDKKPYSRTSLLGCGDTSSTTIFDPLIVMNTDKIIEKLSVDEIKKGNIRFVKLVSGKLDLNNKNNDFDLDRVLYIDLSKLRFSSHNYGEVDMYIKPNNERLYDKRDGYMDRIPIIIKTYTKAKADNLF